MRKMSAFIAIAAMASQLATPAFAAEISNPTGPQGWRRQSEASAMAYFRMPLGVARAHGAQPRFGIMALAPRPYGANDPALYMDAPVLVDVGFTGRDLNSKWTAALTVGDTVAWAQDPAALPPGTRVRLFEDAPVTWLIVGLATIGAGVGIFAVIDKKR